MTCRKRVPLDACAEGGRLRHVMGLLEVALALESLLFVLDAAAVRC